MATFGPWTYSVDRDATAKAYAETPLGGADTCDCAWCRNFRLARDAVFPPAFLALLDDLGIDARKDGEVYACGMLGENRHFYGGWFHFVGQHHGPDDLPPVPLGPDFSASLTTAYAPRRPVFQDAQLVQLSFNAEAVPWLLDEPELG